SCRRTTSKTFRVTYSFPAQEECHRVIPGTSRKASRSQSCTTTHFRFCPFLIRCPQTASDSPRRARLEGHLHDHTSRIRVDRSWVGRAGVVDLPRDRPASPPSGPDDPVTPATAVADLRRHPRTCRPTRGRGQWPLPRSGTHQGLCHPTGARTPGTARQ